MTVYSAWFWIAGKDSSQFLDHECGTSVFFFARIPPHSFNRISKFFAAGSIYYCFAVLSLLSVLLGSIVVEAWERGWPGAIGRVLCKVERAQATEARLRRGDISALAKAPWYHKALVLWFAIGYPISLLYSLLSIELMLRWNHITDVYSVRSIGQLIPLVIGIGGLLKLGYDAMSTKVRIHRIQQSTERTNARSVWKGRRSDAFDAFDKVDRVDGNRRPAATLFHRGRSSSFTDTGREMALY